MLFDHGFSLFFGKFTSSNGSNKIANKICTGTRYFTFLFLFLVFHHKFLLFWERELMDLAFVDVLAMIGS
jgi:hypothetical protein